jgi:hypothetical protein
MFRASRNRWIDPVVFASTTSLMVPASVVFDSLHLVEVERDPIETTIRADITRGERGAGLFERASGVAGRALPRSASKTAISATTTVGELARSARGRVELLVWRASSHLGRAKSVCACVGASESVGLLAQPVHKCILFLMCSPGGFDALSD